MSQNVDDPMGLSRLYHLNSEPWLDERGGPPADFLQKAKSYAHAPRVALPDTNGGSHDALAEARRSVRSFADEPLPLGDLAQVLRSGYRALGPGAASSMLRRPVPSAGALYPLELYALVRNVDGLQPGIYHYDAVGDTLEQVSTKPWQDSGSAAFLTWSFVEHAPVILCLSAVFARSQEKYGPRGYRYILLEAGHVGQNMCLRAAEMGCDSLFLGGYNDAVLNALIELDGSTEAVVYTMALGREADGSQPHGR